MTYWGYLILIVALLGLAGVMLYARFASRSREKSLHHAPVDWVFPDGVISRAESLETEKPVAGIAATTAPNEPASSERGTEPTNGERGDRGENSDGSHAPAEPILRVGQNASESEASPVDRRERDYIDELQEAAAGLAMLMRSSPVSRPQPVVFAPEERSSHAAVPEEVAEVPTSADPEEAIVPEAEGAWMAVGEDEAPDLAEAERVVFEREVEPVEANVSEEAEIVVVSSEEKACEESGGTTEPEPFFEEVACEDEVSRVSVARSAPEPRALGEILGEAVMEQLGRIDEGLDALEALVLGIESSLRALHDLDRNEIELDPADAGGLAAA